MSHPPFVQDANGANELVELRKVAGSPAVYLLANGSRDCSKVHTHGQEQLTGWRIDAGANSPVADA